MGAGPRRLPVLALIRPAAAARRMPLAVAATLAIILLAGGCGAHVYHVVQRGETLYSISFRYHQDYRRVAEWNGIEPPYTIRVGQRIRIIPPRDRPLRGIGRGIERDTRGSQAAVPAGDSVARPGAGPGGAERATRADDAGTGPAVASSGIVWQWPVPGQPPELLGRTTRTSKGVDITGRQGEPVRAAADGRVVYSGSGIPHYGRLLIIKHNPRFISAYAHNARLLVTEGERVTAGQPIAEMGDSGTGADTVKLHFEIRLDGESVDPLRYLPGAGP